MLYANYLENSVTLGTLDLLVACDSNLPDVPSSKKILWADATRLPPPFLVFGWLPAGVRAVAFQCAGSHLPCTRRILAGGQPHTSRWLPTCRGPCAYRQPWVLQIMSRRDKGQGAAECNIMNEENGGKTPFSGRQHHTSQYKSRNHHQYFLHIVHRCYVL